MNATNKNNAMTATLNSDMFESADEDGQETAFVCWWVTIPRDHKSGWSNGREFRNETEAKAFQAKVQAGLNAGMSPATSAKWHLFTNTRGY